MAQRKLIILVALMLLAGRGWAEEFGYHTIGGTGINQGVGTVVANKFTLSENGTVSQISVYMAGTIDNNVKALIYADAAGYPGDLLATGAETAVNTTTAWKNFDVAASLAAGTYWIGYVVQSNYVTTYYDDGDTNQRYTKQLAGYYATPPNPFPAAGTGTARKVSMYATYTPTGAGATTTDNQVILIQ